MSCHDRRGFRARKVVSRIPYRYFQKRLCFTNSARAAPVNRRDAASLRIAPPVVLCDAASWTTVIVRTPWRWVPLLALVSCAFAVLCPAVAHSASQRETSASTAVPASAQPGQRAEQELWLAVEVNRSGVSEPVLLLQLANGHLLARGDDLKRWRLRLPLDAAVMHAGDAFYALDALPGLVYSVDEPRQILFVDAPPELFLSTVLHGQSASSSVPAPPPPGAFFNYDISSQHSAGQYQTGGLFDLGLFNSRGVGTSGFVARDYGTGAHVVRLDTTWTQDRPADLASLRIGDSISTPGDWGRSIRFGGVQWGTNFATQPGFVPFPMPGFAGEAALPSAVDLFVDNALRMTRDVPSGPFNILDLPVVTGSGTAVIVVRDLLGRQQVVSLPYYVSPRLLQAGLNDFSYEAGFVRDDYGIDSNNYGRLAAIGTQRHGFTDWFTGEAHAEVLREQQTGGVGATLLLPAAGVLSASVAGSETARTGTGGLLSLGLERQTERLSFGGSVQFMSTRFVQVGLPPGTVAPRALGQAFVSLATTGHGAFGLSYALQDNRGEDSVRLASLSYGISVGRLGYVSLSAVRILSGNPATTFGMNFTRTLGERTSASAAVVRQPEGSQTLLNVQRNLPLGDGFGYRIEAAAGSDPRADANLVLQNGVGTYSLDAEQSHGQTSLRGEVSGGVALLGGDFFLSRRIDQSFGLVQVAGYPNVHIYADNQLVAVTDANGNALVPRLRAYEDNAIRIEQADLPLDAEIDTLLLQAVPFLRSGVVVTFPVRRSLGGLVTITLDDGQPLPAGAVVRIGGQSQEFPAGRRGEVYLTGLSSSNRLSVSWHDQHCELTVPFRATAEPLPHLGSYLCSGVAE